MTVALPHTGPTRSGRLLGALLLLLSVGYYAALAPYGLELADEGHLVNQIYRTYLGQVPYIDFQTGYTPGVYYWNAALFWLFGVNLLVVRFCLALVNGLTVYCIYWLARRVGESRLAAAVTALLYLAFVPFHDGQFAPFNIPYPAWYVTLFWLLSVICMVRVWESGRAFLWLVAGLCAGVVFAFKQNSGLFNLAAVGITVALIERPVADGVTRRGRLSGILQRWEPRMHWLVPLVGALGITLMFRHSAGPHEMNVFAVPLVVVVVWQLGVASAQVARPVRVFDLWRDMLLVAVGFAAITLPWAVYFWIRLGPMAFLRAIFYLGVGYEQFYFIGYPDISRFGVALAAAIAASLVAGLLSRRWLRPAWVVTGLIVGATAAVYWLVRHPPPMVEGFQRSVVMRVYDVGFTLLLFTEWTAIVVYAWETRRGRASSEPTRHAAGIFLIVLLSAILMHAQLYPRSDFMHLVYAAPCILVVGARQLDVLAYVWARALARRRRTRLAIRIAVAAPVCVVALVVLSPSLARIDYLARAGWGRDANAVVRLTAERAPLLIDPAAGRMFLSLSATVRYLQEHSRPDQFVFTFPCLEFVNFLSGRQDPTRHGYYYPGSPGHAVEAEVIDTLRAHAPRHIVALHDHALFFVGAPLYYFNLHQFVTHGYRLERRLGMLDVLRPVGRRQGAAPKPPGIVSTATSADAEDEWAVEGEGARVTDDLPQGEMLADTIGLWRRELEHSRGSGARALEASLGQLSVPSIAGLGELIAGLDPDGQRQIAGLVLKSRSAAGAAALAVALQIAPPAESTAELFLRVIAASGDLRAVVPLLQVLRVSEAGTHDSVAGTLFNVASKSSIEDYWYAPSDPPELPDIERALPAEQLIAWMDNPWESLALRSFAIHVCAQRHNPVFIPFLVRLLGDSHEPPQLRADAARSLTDLGFGAQIFPSIGALLRGGDLQAAVLTVALYPEAPDVGRDLLSQAMASTDDWVRLQAFWVAAAVQDPQLLPQLRAGLADSVFEIREAAAWALGSSGDVGSTEALQEAAHGGNDEVEAFAQRAIQRIVSQQPAAVP